MGKEMKAEIDGMQIKFIPETRMECCTLGMVIKKASEYTIGTKNKDLENISFSIDDIVNRLAFND